MSLENNKNQLFLTVSQQEIQIYRQILENYVIHLCRSNLTVMAATPSALFNYSCVALLRRFVIIAIACAFPDVLKPASVLTLPFRVKTDAG